MASLFAQPRHHAVSSPTPPPDATAAADSSPLPRLDTAMERADAPTVLAVEGVAAAAVLVVEGAATATMLVVKGAAAGIQGSAWSMWGSC